MFYLKVGEEQLFPDNLKFLNDYFTEESWNEEKKEFDYEIVFQKESGVDIMFEEMKTCSGGNTKVELKLFDFEIVEGFQILDLVL